jgi:peptidoglycan biosynthesis protein MviN/MurJ (putative lipid II flippase)
MYAQRTPWTVLSVNGLQTALRLGGNVVLAGWLGYKGIAVSAALGLTLQMMLLGRLVRGRLGVFLTRVFWRASVRAILAVGAAAAVASAILTGLSSASALQQVVAAGTSGTLVYAVVLGLLWVTGKASANA